MNETKKINNRIDALNGKFANYKTIGLGAEDATSRYTQNIPAEIPSNFSAGYSGQAMIELRKQFKKAK